MEYTKKEFGKELNKRISQGHGYREISKWAFDVYIEHGLEFENGLDYFVLKLVAMQEGPEFFLSDFDLKTLAEKLISEEVSN